MCKSSFAKSTLPLIIDFNIESLDIDTEQDSQYAEYYLDSTVVPEEK